LTGVRSGQRRKEIRKCFEYLRFPGAGHGVGESPYGKRERVEFIQRHLGGPMDAD
jgi:hypothetical protein